MYPAPAVNDGRRLGKLVVAVLLLAAAGLALASALALHTTQLRANGHELQVEVADSKASRTLGLMFRRSLGTNEGMLFAYPGETRMCMWMRFTFIPLTVAFVAADGTVVNLADMEPHTDARHCASAPAKYAVEANQGWFSAHGIGAGTRLEGLPR
jgi:uncharacterized membrane protein (UPF0127 family)